MSFFNQAIFKSLIFLLFFVASGFGAGHAIGSDDLGIGLIRADRLNMRNGPGLDQPVKKVLPRGTCVVVLAETQGWLRVSHEEDIGFISRRAEYVRYPLDSDKAGRDGEIAALQAEVGRVKEKIRAQREEIAAYSRQEKKMVDALDAIDRKMAAARQKLREIEESMAAVNRELAGIREQVEALESSLADEREYASSRLVALHKMNSLGEMNLLASAASMHEFLNRRAALEKILEYDQRVVAGMLEKQAKLKTLLASLDARKSRKKTLENQYGRTIAALEKQKAERKQVLAEIRSKTSNRQTNLKYLRDAADRLEQTLSELKAPDPEPKASAPCFAAYQGLLNMPVDGKIISDYGKYTDPRSGVACFRNGIEIQAARGAPVQAVFSGETIYADWLKGYGNVIILAHGNDYHTVYAHAEELFLKKGDHVEAGDVIATVGDSASLSGAALYFEVRHGGDPVNPLKWIDNS